MHVVVEVRTLGSDGRSYREHQLDQETLTQLRVATHRLRCTEGLSLRRVQAAPAARHGVRRSLSYEQGPNPNGNQSADGYYHPEDEVFLPWFMRSSPNTISLATQTASANGGRYTLLGSLNQFAGFGKPATGC